MRKTEITFGHIVYIPVLAMMLLLPGCEVSKCTCRKSLKTGLVGYWKLESDSKDYSGNENHGRNFAVVFSGKEHGDRAVTAANFNGIDSYIEVPGSQSLDLGSGDFSVSAWVYTEKDLRDNPGDIVSKYDSQSRRGFNFVIMNYGGAVDSQSDCCKVLFGIDNGKSITCDYHLEAGWRHLVSVRNGNKLKLYIDGKLTASSSEFNPADYDISNDKPFKIGFGQHDYFNGKISQLRLYNRALAVEEIETLYEMK